MIGSTPLRTVVAICVAAASGGLVAALDQAPARAAAPAASAPAGAPANAPATRPLWGMDSASFVGDVLGSAEAKYGRPQFFGRYVSRKVACNGNGISGDDAHRLLSAGISIVLLDYSDGCNPPTFKVASYRDGQDAASNAIAAATQIGVPQGVALYEDVEYNAPVKDLFLEGFADTIVSKSKYLPGFYGDPNPILAFNKALCAAVDTDSRVARSLFWASSPSWPGGRTSQAQMPPFGPGKVKCPTGQATKPPAAIGWQYARTNLAQTAKLNVDTDEFIAATGMWSPPADGSFLAAGSTFYQIVGAAPVPVTSWTPFGGPQPATTVDPKVIGYLSSYPADGTTVRSDDGTDYVFAGGAPLYVSNLRLLGNPHPLLVNAYPLDHFASSGEYSHVLRYPATGTVLREAQTGNLYTVADGVAQYVATSSKPAVKVDAAAIEGAGGQGPFEHLARPDGYWLVSGDGAVSGAGQAADHGSATLTGADRAVGIAPTGDGGGYWVATRDGSVENFGDARFYGDLPSHHVFASDIVAIAPTPDGNGYWLIGADGGEFAFGDARYHGSLPGVGVHVHNVVGMVASGRSGYILVGADGGVFVFGGRFHGSLPGLGVHVSDIVGLLPTGGGYVLVGRDGGAFVFGRGAGYYGSLPGKGIRADDIAGLALTGDERGYWMAGADGSVFPFGDAVTFATPPGVATNLPVTGIAGA